jgi:aminoglycoside 3-N-acetyltransferase
MIGFAELTAAFQALRLPGEAPVIAHASLSAFGPVEGGAGTVVSALLEAFRALVMPAFTYKTMVVPEVGPADNALQYGQELDRNRQAVFYDPSMPVDRLIGAVPEALRGCPRAQRSAHPILSFAGVNAAGFLEDQSLQEPLAPIRLLAEARGWVVLLGVDHMVNTSIHYGERLAGRRQFVRWALTPGRIVECPGFPGCSDGFGSLTQELQAIIRQVQVGNAIIQAVPLVGLTQKVVERVRSDPLALLCDRFYCDRCRTIENLVVQNRPS